MDINDYLKLLKRCHNIILTGAPGTGKTYLARQMAAQMVLGKSNVESLTKEQEEILNNRTAFVQFHPSYDYTDFVEGLRPIRNGDDEIGFERKNGLFKDFCKNALLHNKSYRKHDNDDDFGQLTEKQQASIIYTEILKKCFHKGGFIVGEKTFKVDTNQSNCNLYVPRNNGNSRPDKVSLNSILQYFDDPNRTQQHRGNDTNKELLYKYIKEEIEKRSGSKTSVERSVDLDNDDNDNYVFIIDEINRGELSKIFGELFFSIDPGYRGKNVRVRTQYQNLITQSSEDEPFSEGFYVPENVYIIGTMNDIDRSIESMDFATRRRFAWVEVKANEHTTMLKRLGDDLCDKAINVMKVLNNRIWNESEKRGIEGLSIAYHIGASYFLKLEEFKDSQNPFKELWEYHLEGLLKEYLRGQDDGNETLEQLKKDYNEASGIN